MSRLRARERADGGCQAVRSGNRVWLSGQTGLALVGGGDLPEDAGAQAARAIANVRTLLEEAGSGLEHITKITTWLTDLAWRPAVYAALDPHMKAIPTVGTGLIAKGLERPEMKVLIDVDAVVPEPGGAHERIHVFNTRDWFDQKVERTSCKIVRTADEIFLRGQTGAAPDGSRQYGGDFTPAGAAEQADVAMTNARALLEEAGSGFDEVCKLRVYICDRAFREPVYQVLGRHLGDVHPCSTGLIVGGLFRAPLLFEIDMAIMRAQGSPHRRLRRFETRDQYKDGQDLRCRFSMAVRAGNRVFLRGQTGNALDGEFVGYGDAAAQAEQAMQNVRRLLDEAGASLDDACKVTVFLGDRAWVEPVREVVSRHIDGVGPACTTVIVNGFASTRVLVEIDVEAVIAT